MLDIRFIRENPELVEQKAKQKGYEVDIKKLLELDNQYRKLISEIEDLRAKRNEISQSISVSPSASASEYETSKDVISSSSEAIVESKGLKDGIRQRESGLEPIRKERLKLLKNVPNMPADDVPIGVSEAENVVSKEWGEKPQFDFKPKTHWEIAEARGLIDKERAAKVTGSRFAYITGDLVKLQFALIQFTLTTLTNEEILKKIIDDAGLKGISTKTFIPILPPLMIRTEVFDAMDRLEPRDDRYKVGEENDNLWLQGSAEHTLGPMFMNEIIAEDDLPKRYLGYATSFRREAGTYGKDTEGIIRMHQFDKLEMESFSTPDQGLNEHLLMIAIQEYLMQQLKLPYRVLQKCTADIGKPNARGIDIEAWLPGVDSYKETHTADFMTDYQSRRLSVRYKKIGEAGMGLVHTNDATAFAMGRTLVAIIENYQNQDGTIKVPEILQSYMGGTASI